MFLQLVLISIAHFPNFTLKVKWDMLELQTSYILKKDSVPWSE